eukprot:724177-Alexandrium_andersonii.AAC.1
MEEGRSLSFDIDPSLQQLIAVQALLARSSLADCYTADIWLDGRVLEQVQGAVLTPTPVDWTPAQKATELNRLQPMVGKMGFCTSCWASVGWSSHRLTS